MNRIAASELIINPDGSVYHLNLLPEDIATTIITVGDPDRVDSVSRYFDSVEIKKSHYVICIEMFVLVRIISAGNDTKLPIYMPIKICHDTSNGVSNLN